METVAMPKMGSMIQDGTILCWMKLVGDAVNRDDSLAEIETDKVNIELSSPASGVVRAIFVSTGETVPVGTVLALIGATDEPLPDPLPRQPVIVTQRCSDRANQQKQPSLVSLGQQGGWLGLFIAFFVLIHPGSWLATI